MPPARLHARYRRQRGGTAAPSLAPLSRPVPACAQRRAAAAMAGSEPVPSPRFRGRGRIRPPGAVRACPATARAHDRPLRQEMALPRRPGRHRGLPVTLWGPSKASAGAAGVAARQPGEAVTGHAAINVPGRPARGAPAAALRGASARHGPHRGAARSQDQAGEYPAGRRDHQPPRRSCVQTCESSRCARDSSACFLPVLGRSEFAVGLLTAGTH